MRIETKTDNRRKMVQDIAEYIGEELHYVGPPTFSYTVGRLTIDRDGVITSETEEGEELLTQFLQEKGYLEAPVDEVKLRSRQIPEMENFEKLTCHDPCTCLPAQPDHKV